MVPPGHKINKNQVPHKGMILDVEMRKCSYCKRERKRDIEKPVTGNKSEKMDKYHNELTILIASPSRFA